jgi:hypothetical protein
VLQIKPLCSKLCSNCPPLWNRNLEVNSVYLVLCEHTKMNVREITWQGNVKSYYFCKSLFAVWANLLFLVWILWRVNRPQCIQLFTLVLVLMWWLISQGPPVRGLGSLGWLMIWNFVILVKVRYSVEMAGRLEYLRPIMVHLESKQAVPAWFPVMWNKKSEIWINPWEVLQIKPFMFQLPTFVK